MHILWTSRLTFWKSVEKYQYWLEIILGSVSNLKMIYFVLMSLKTLATNKWYGIYL